MRLRFGRFDVCSGGARRLAGGLKTGQRSFNSQLVALAIDLEQQIASIDCVVAVDLHRRHRARYFRSNRHD